MRKRQEMPANLCRRCVKSVARLLSVLALGTLLLPAATNIYILATSPGNLSEVLARHHLALEEVLRNGIYEVTSAPGVSVSKLQKEIAGDDLVMRFEGDGTLGTTESKPGAKIQPSISALARALSDHSTLNYFGAIVRGAYVHQPAAGLIELPQALSRWGAGNTTVAVIDTGVDPNHPALRGVLVSGYDFTRNIAGPASELADLTQSTVAILEQSTVAILEHKNAPVILNQSTVAILEQSTVAILEGAKLPSEFGHGTMVAGLIHLVAPGARIMPLKAFKADGSSNLSDIIKAIYYAVDHNARVINMSFATTSPSAELAAAVAYAKAHRVICVAAAGNDGKEQAVYPASLGYVIGVGSTSLADVRSPFSNFGDAAARTAAPGEALITTYPGNNYAGVWGTSFSSALVSGAAALMTQISPYGSPSDFSDALAQGHRINQDMGDARLDIMSSLYYLSARH